MHSADLTTVVICLDHRRAAYHGGGRKIGMAVPADDQVDWFASAV